MSKTKELFNDKGELLDKGMREYVRRQCDLENRILALLVDNNIDTDKAVKKLDVLFHEHAKDYDAVTWEGFVTMLTYDVQERCKEFDEHVRPSILSRLDD